MIERFGSFTIIVLAESILAIVSGIAEVKDKDPAAWITFMLGIIITFLLWSLYFDMTSEQQTKKGYQYLQWLIFLHFPLLASFGVVGACIKIILEDMDASQHMTVQWIFCSALAMILLMIVCIAAIMDESEEDRAYIKPVSRLLIITLILVMFVPVFGSYLNTIAFLSVITILLLIPVLVGVRSWVRFKFFSNR